MANSSWNTWGSHPQIRDGSSNSAVTGETSYMAAMTTLTTPSSTSTFMTRAIR